SGSTPLWASMSENCSSTSDNRMNSPPIVATILSMTWRCPSTEVIVRPRKQRLKQNDFIFLVIKHFNGMAAHASVQHIFAGIFQYLEFAFVQNDFTRLIF